MIADVTCCASVVETTIRLTQKKSCDHSQGLSFCYNFFSMSAASRTRHQRFMSPLLEPSKSQSPDIVLWGQQVHPHAPTAPFPNNTPRRQRRLVRYYPNLPPIRRLSSVNFSYLCGDLSSSLSRELRKICLTRPPTCSSISPTASQALRLSEAVRCSYTRSIGPGRSRGVTT
jgi:hypothetical protein